VLIASGKPGEDERVKIGRDLVAIGQRPRSGKPGKNEPVAFSIGYRLCLPLTRLNGGVHLERLTPRGGGRVVADAATEVGSYAHDNRSLRAAFARLESEKRRDSQ
jgi:hypothetical protein